MAPVRSATRVQSSTCPGPRCLVPPLPRSQLSLHSYSSWCSMGGAEVQRPWLRPTNAVRPNATRFAAPPPLTVPADLAPEPQHVTIFPPQQQQPFQTHSTPAPIIVYRPAPTAAISQAYPSPAPAPPVSLPEPAREADGDLAAPALVFDSGSGGGASARAAK